MSFITPDINDKGILKPKQNNLRKPEKNDRHTRNFLLAISLIIVLINIPRCFSGNFWLDECFTIYVSQKPFDWIVGLSNSWEMHPPLYYIVISGMVKIFGSSPFVFHFTTLVIFLLMLVVISTAVFSQFGKLAALITMAFAAFLLSGLRYMIEARMYEMGLVFTLCAFISFYYILNYNRKIDWCIFVASSLIAAYSYYLCILAVGLLYLILLLYAIAKMNSEKNYLKGIIVSMVVSVVCYIPCIIPVIESFGRGITTYWVNTFTPLLILDYLFFFFGIVFVPLLIYLAYRELKKNRESNPNKKGLFKMIDGAKTDSIWIVGGIAAVFGTILIIFIVSLVFKPICVSNHIYPISAVAWLLLAVLISRVDFDSIRKYVPTIIAVSAITMCATYGYTVIDEKLKCDSTQNILNNTTDIKSGDIIITDHDSFQYTDGGIIDYYYPGCIPMYKEKLTIPELDKSKQYWLFIKNAITEETEDELAKQGYKSEYRANGSFAEYYDIYVYKIVKI